MSDTEWYAQPVERVFETLKSSGDGLTTREAEVRIKKYGYNELKFKKTGVITRLLLQFHNPLIYVLLVAAFVTAYFQEYTDTAVIVGVVIANTIIGFILEGKAQSSIESLGMMMPHYCTVLRDGKKMSILAKELVPGDIVLLKSGDKVPADLRLFYAKNLFIDESALTGESIPVEKSTEPIQKPDLPPADQHCMAFSGTFVTQGSGKGIVVATGEQTELGKIAKIVMETREISTPLMREMAEFTKIIVITTLAVAALNFVLGIAFGYDFFYSLMASVALAVAAIPEGLPAVLTITLALGVTALAHKNALIKKLPSVETLGCTTVICTDKTGTLTKNQMTVVKIYSGGKYYSVTGVGYEPEGEFILDNTKIDPSQDGDLIEILRAGILCNDAGLTVDDGEYRITGDPTEVALVVSAMKAGIDRNYPRIDEIPFDSERQYMATLHKGDGRNILYVKGTPERILEMCKHQLINGRVKPVMYEEMLKVAHEMAKDALRVLGFAYKIVPEEKGRLTVEDLEDLTFLGFQGMIDPPREEAREAVEKCRRAGIRVVMVTGDHAQTARAIAKHLGICGEEDRVVTGEELSRMDDEELQEIVDDVRVYARVSPEHKFRIVRQLQKKGHVVAVTGDGVNDAPALKVADIGIAMGIMGTDVSKDASDMILADDNFASIVDAVEEGRHIFENIRKIILYTIPTNGGQALMMLLAVILAPFIPLFTLRLPLEPIQILWINLADAVFLALPLAMEPREKGLLEKAPRDPGEQIINRLFFRKVGLVAVVMAIAGFTVYYYFGAKALSNPGDELLLTQAQTAAFAAVIAVHIFYLFTARSITESALTFSPFSNKWILAGVAISAATLLMIVYVPSLQIPFRTTAIPPEWWIPIILLASSGFIVIEVEKFLIKRLGKS
ncbi:cation-translocating P-type ATPase [Archaeoglobus neptunius]|uniref:cation-translocating P-type ATPase n=1 Tax=Archaeoglobus neptunius TaxID=2798580 RepID=UPI0019252763